MKKEKERYVIDLDILNKSDELLIAKTCDGLANPIRVKIVRRLCDYPYLHSFNRLSSELKIPKTTLNYHLSKLEEAGIVRIFYKNAHNKSVKIVSKIVNNISITTRKIEAESMPQSKSNRQEIPVGAYDSYVGNGIDFIVDSEATSKTLFNYYDARRFKAKLVFAKEGIVSYKASNAFAVINGIDELKICLEICSEAPYYILD